uniref:Uncharacterized protein n=1 Tax=Timema bartmani TaxID=61472 RepID=A0A7R9HY36_9NEOP|nr:unnamed protein product [Timema bartmani]
MKGNGTASVSPKAAAFAASWSTLKRSSMGPSCLDRKAVENVLTACWKWVDARVACRFSEIDTALVAWRPLDPMGQPCQWEYLDADDSISTIKSELLATDLEVLCSIPGASRFSVKPCVWRRFKLCFGVTETTRGSILRKVLDNVLRFSLPTRIPVHTNTYQFHVSRGIEEQVLRFEVSVDEPSVMKELESLDHAPHDEPHSLLLELLVPLQRREEVTSQTGLHQVVHVLAVLVGPV